MQTSTPETKEQAALNLFEFSTILKDLGIVHWIDGGTLLGAYRDGDFCDGDEDDVDIFTWANYKHLIPQVIERAEKLGFFLHMHWTGDSRAPGKAPEIAMKRTMPDGRKLKIDLNFFEKKGDTAWGLAFTSDNRGIPQVCPVRFYEELGTITFRGREYNCPRDVEGYLAHRYGDWRTPVHRTVYSCYNPDQLKALTPDFVFYDTDE